MNESFEKPQSNNLEKERDVEKELQNQLEIEILKDINDPLIREQIKRITVFGTFSEPTQEDVHELRQLGKTLSKLQLTILMGGNYGYLKEVGQGAIENNGKIIIVGTTEGANKGWKTENIPGRLRGVYYEGGYSGKKRGLLHESVGAYIVLPSDTLGTYTEMTEAVDKMASFDKYLDKIPRPVIFVGDFWRQKFDTEVKPRISDDVLQHIYFVQNQEEIPAILKKYAELKKDHELSKE